MNSQDWWKTFPGSIVVTDEKGIITEMNDFSIESYRKDGGAQLIGKNIMDCHPEPSLSKVKELFAESSMNAYMITKNGKQKMIYQAPYFRNGSFAGMVELSLPLPDDLQHFNRDKKQAE